MQCVLAVKSVYVALGFNSASVHLIANQMQIGRIEADRLREVDRTRTVRLSIVPTFSCGAGHQGVGGKPQPASRRGSVTHPFARRGQGVFGHHNATGTSAIGMIMIRTMNQA